MGQSQSWNQFFDAIRLLSMYLNYEFLHDRLIYVDFLLPW